MQQPMGQLAESRSSFYSKGGLTNNQYGNLMSIDDKKS